MNSDEIATIKFGSVDPVNDGFAVIRVVGENMAICLSVQQGGDAEVLINAEECEKLVEAIKKGLKQIQK